jgi:hypothetical protein
MPKRPWVADRRGRSIALPPSRIGRLLVALRESVGRRALNPDSDPRFRKVAQRLKRVGLIPTARNCDSLGIPKSVKL